ncbi:sugar transferase [soil metagenome]
MDLSAKVLTRDTSRRRAASFITHSARTPRTPRALVIGDALCIFVAFVLPVLMWTAIPSRNWYFAIIELSAMTVLGLWSMRVQGLWTERVTAVRLVEVSKITRALVLASLACLVLDRKATMLIRIHDLIPACVLAWVALVMWRSAYRSYMGSERRHGRKLNRVVIVGTERRALDLHRLFEVHPELGMRVTTIVGSQEAAEQGGVGHLWAGSYLDAGVILSSVEVDAVVICSDDLDPAVVHALTHQERDRRRQLFVDPGLSGVDFRRVQTTAIAHQPLLEVQSPSLAGFELMTKRVFDIAVASIVALIALPVAIAVAIAIKLEDGGSVFFRQERVGQGGETFPMYKFRTMVMDAEARLAKLAENNERKGPLFKMDHDPRVTRVGRFLRATSLDELPQLLNVLRGSMSLVGPRPALPAEVAAFPADLHDRHQVQPGITGLWQVEARDNPSFEAYRRLDLFYVENWSIALDFIILLATIDHIVFRPLIKLRYRNQSSIQIDEPASGTSASASGVGSSSDRPVLELVK